MKKLYQSPVLDIVLFEMEHDILMASGSAEVDSPWKIGDRVSGSRSSKEEQ